MKPIQIKILSQQEKDFEDRDVVFGVKIFEPEFVLEHKNSTDGIKHPRLSKRKNECIVSIIGDFEDIEPERNIENELKDFEAIPPATWRSQIIKACILSPQFDGANCIQVPWYN